MAPRTPKIPSLRLDDDRLAVIRRRQEIDTRFGGPRCGAGQDASDFRLRAGDVEILEVMVREGDPQGGSRSRRTALAGLASVRTLDSAEVLVGALRDQAAHPGIRVNALVSLDAISPVLGGAYAGQLMHDESPQVRQAAGGVLRQHRGERAATTPRKRSAGRPAKRTPRRDA